MGSWCGRDLVVEETNLQEEADSGDLMWGVKKECTRVEAMQDKGYKSNSDKETRLQATKGCLEGIQAKEKKYDQIDIHKSRKFRDKEKGKGVIRAFDFMLNMKAYIGYVDPVVAMAI